MDWGPTPSYIRDDEESERFLTMSARDFTRQHSFSDGSLQPVASINHDADDIDTEHTPLKLPSAASSYVVFVVI
jgi:hypothetical protein